MPSASRRNGRYGRAATRFHATPSRSWSGWHGPLSAIASRGEWPLVHDRAPNAFAAGAGSLYLTDGALEFARTESELAAILVHEMGHQISGHFCPRERSVFFSWLFGRSDDMAEASRKDVRKKDLGSISLVINPVKEQEADRQAVAILREAGYDPHAMLEVARRLPSGGRPSHLQDPRRLQSLETSLATLPSIEIDESQAFEAAKRDLEAELRGW
jgi:beta-barrel assembly-enhancing protease